MSASSPGGPEEEVRIGQISADALRAVVLSWRPWLEHMPIEYFRQEAEDLWWEVTGEQVPATLQDWRRLADQIAEPAPEAPYGRSIPRLAERIAEHWTQAAEEELNQVSVGRYSFGPYPMKVDSEGVMYFEGSALPPMNDSARAAAEYIDEHPGAQGAEIAEAIFRTENYFRRDLLPVLRAHGYGRRPGRKGYFPPWHP